MSYRLIAPHELDATLTDAWRAIQSRTDAYVSPYFCPEFTQLVASVRNDVRVAVIENDGRPVGFFPHQRSFLGMGKPVGGPLSDYHGVIAEPGSEWSVSELMQSAKLSVWAFDHLVDEPGKFAPYVTARATSPRINLSAGFENYLSRFGGRLADVGRKVRKVEREVAPLSFEFHDPSNINMECLITWKTEQIRRTRVSNVFGVHWTGELLRRIMNVQSTDFAGVCSVLRAGDEVVAVHAGMRSRNMLHWWFPTYNRKFEKYSVGTILLFRIAEAAAAIGIRTVDLGKGDSQYKQRVMTDAADLVEGFVELPSLLASARKLQRAAEARVPRGPLAAPLRLPLRAIRRIERIRRFH